MKQNLIVGFPPKCTYSIKLVGSPIFDMHTHLYHHLRIFNLVLGKILLELFEPFTEFCLVELYNQLYPLWLFKVYFLYSPRISVFSKAFCHILSLILPIYFVFPISFHKELTRPPSMVNVMS